MSDAQQQVLGWGATSVRVPPGLGQEHPLSLDTSPAYSLGAGGVESLTDSRFDLGLEITLNQLGSSCCGSEG